MTASSKPVRCTDVGAGQVDIAFYKLGSQPADDAWTTCDWLTSVQGAVVVPVDQPGGINLTTLGGRGQYYARARITDSPKIPVIPMAGVALTVT